MMREMWSAGSGGKALVAAVFGVAALIVLVVVLIFYDLVSPTAAAARASEAAWKQRCIDKGGTLLPTDRYQIKGQARYAGWVCAKLVRIEP